MVALVYYGIGMSMTQLGGDIFINFILAAVGEILGYFYNLIVADYWGRKPTLVVSFLICGICCIASGYSAGTMKLVLALIGIEILIL